MKPDTPKPRVLVTGARGFVGRNICQTLADQGFAVRGLSRTLPQGNEAVANVAYIRGDIKEAADFPEAALFGCTAIVHCVGIITEDRAQGQTFEAIHVEGTRHLLTAAKTAGTITRFVYLSAAGSSSTARAAYSRTKAAAEALIAESGIRYTVFRPSIILGRGCTFVEQMEGLIRRPPLSPFPLPFVPVPGTGKNLFQPVHISDLAACVVSALTQDTALSATLEIGGADRVTFDALLEAFQRRLGTHKKLLHIPMPLMFAGASVLEALLPHPPITTDQLYNLQRDNVCDNKGIEEAFGFHPMGFLEALNRDK